MAVEKDVVFVRIRPFDKNKQRVRTFSAFGLKFVEGKWYKVNRVMTKAVEGIMKNVNIADYLRDARNEHAPESINIFDVVDTQREADAIVEREKRAAEGNESASTAVDLTSGDAPAAPAKRRPGRPRKIPLPEIPAGDTGA